MDNAHEVQPFGSSRHLAMVRVVIASLAVVVLALAMVDSGLPEGRVGRLISLALGPGSLTAGLFGAMLLGLVISAVAAWFATDPIESALSLWFISLVPALMLAADYLTPLLGGLLGQESLRRITVCLMMAHVVAHLHLFQTCFGVVLAKSRLAALYQRAIPVATLLAALAWLVPSAGLPAYGVSCLTLGVGLLAAGLNLSWRGRKDAQRYTYAAAVAVQLLCALSQIAMDVGWWVASPGWRVLSFWNGSAVFVAFAALMVIERRRDRRERDLRVRRDALESSRKYRHVYYSAPVGLVSATVNGHVLRWNDLAQTLFGDLLLNGRLNMLSIVLGESQAARLLADLQAGSPHKGEIRLAAGDRVLAYDALMAGGAIELSFMDVSERSRLADAFEHMANHDFLTDLLNRRGLEWQIEQALKKVQAGERASLLYLDLDRFKAINDVFGHAAGDAVIIEVGQRMARTLGPEASIGRVGGDEFLALLPHIGLSEARALASRLMNALTREQFSVAELNFEVEASIGVVEAAAGMQTREVIAQADEACARSKQAGPRKIIALKASDELLDDYRAAVRLGSELKANLPTERMRIYAQPIIGLKGDANVLSYEVLLRALDDNGQIEAPAKLIAAAERQGSMAAIDRFVLQETIEHLNNHPEHAASLGFVAVNLSGMSLNDDRFQRDAVAMLRANKQSANKIVLEITESVALRDVGSTRRFVDRMRDIGVGIALDDFGAGYTSFAYLRDIPASLLKIDGQFIKGLSSDSKHQGIIRAIQQLGREMGMECLAEWVEDVPTLQTLVELEVDYVQGYVFASAKPIAHWLEQAVDLEPLFEANRLIADGMRTTSGRSANVVRPAKGSHESDSANSRLVSGARA